jgi:redox-sensing transcriptional repressor
LSSILGIDQKHKLIVIGVGGLGSALVRHLGLQHDSFDIVAGVDIDPSVVGTQVGPIVVRHSDELRDVMRETGAEVGILTVPAKVAQDNYDALVANGIRAVLNFAPARLDRDRNVQTRSVDVRIILEELAYFVKS